MDRYILYKVRDLETISTIYLGSQMQCAHSSFSLLVDITVTVNQQCQKALQSILWTKSFYDGVDWGIFFVVFAIHLVSVVLIA